MNIKNKIKTLGLCTNSAPILGLIISFIFSVIVSSLNIYDKVTTNSLYFCEFTFISELCAVFLPVLLCCKLYNHKTHYVDNYPYTQKLSVPSAIRWLSFGIAGDIFLNFLNGLFVLLTKQNTEINQPQPSNIKETILLFFAVGIIAPIFEELAFRKLLFGVLRKEGNAFGIIMSGFLFGLWHGNFSQMFFACLIGMLFAYILAKTGNIFLTMAIHIINNSFAVLSSIHDNNLISDGIFGIICLIFTIILIVGFASFIVLIKKKEISFNAIKNTIKSQNKKVYLTFIPYMILPFVLFIALALLERGD